MGKAADLVLHFADPAGFAARLFETIHEVSLYSLIRCALFHYKRDPGWFEVTVEGTRFYACQLIPIPLLVFIQKRVPARQLKAAAERTLVQIEHFSEATDPNAWIMINADLLAPTPRPGVNLWLARKLKDSLARAIFIELDEISEQKKNIPKEVLNHSDLPLKRNTTTAKKKGKNSPDADKVLERVMLGWRVRDICEEQKCSEAYVYKLIKKRKGSSAMDYRWKQWELISAMYHAEPKITIEEIEKACGVSRAVIYHAVRKIADRDGKVITPRERDKKLTPEDVEIIKEKLSKGMLRKDICTEYSITAETLIKYIGTSEDYRPIPSELKEHAVRLRVQGKTLQQTADILGVTVSAVKDVWRRYKNSPEIKEKRVKYDNRNPLTKRDRDQAVNAVLRDGHTRTQIYTQYGINALTLRRYIRDALKKETDALRKDDNESGEEG